MLNLILVLGLVAVGWPSVPVMALGAVGLIGCSMLSDFLFAGWLERMAIQIQLGPPVPGIGEDVQASIKARREWKLLKGRYALGKGLRWTTKRVLQVAVLIGIALRFWERV